MIQIVEMSSVNERDCDAKIIMLEQYLWSIHENEMKSLQPQEFTYGRIELQNEKKLLMSKWKKMSRKVSKLRDRYQRTQHGL